MNEQPVTLDDVTASLERLFAAANGDAPRLLEQAAGLQRARADRLSAAAERLQSAAQAAPRAAVVQRAATAAAGRNDALVAVVGRFGSRPKPDPRRWLVSGRVVGPGGEPAVGVRAQLFDKEHTLDAALGAMVSDQNGDFARAFEQQDFAAGGAVTALQLEVRDARDAVLCSSPDVLHFQAGKADHFEITLAEQPAPPGRTGGRRRASEKSGAGDTPS